ncbi:MAG: hypothetical protein A2Y10_17815 [Planctomycetes bacterium GWF2_41_51]|nr:MAG: hypothetical protein A2Y10_17815 [Planctomycetes bacterium GWF2_41_51]
MRIFFLISWPSILPEIGYPDKNKIILFLLNEIKINDIIILKKLKIWPFSSKMLLLGMLPGFFNFLY